MIEGQRNDNKKRVKLWAMDDDAIRQLMHEINDNNSLITCFNPNCGCRMHVRSLDTDNRVTHFARYPKSGDDRTHSGQTGESPKHKAAKTAISKRMLELYPDADIQAEQTVRGGKYKKMRRVDVAVYLPNGESEAHEAQFAYQTTAKTERRTADAKAMGFDRVVWWWGDHAIKRAYVDWCIDNCEQYGEIRSKTVDFMGVEQFESVSIQVFNSAEILEERKAIAFMNIQRERERLERIYEDDKRKRIERERVAAAQVLRQKIAEEKESARREIAERIRVSTKERKERARILTLPQGKRYWESIKFTQSTDTMGTADIGKTYPTELGGVATITTYNGQHNAYRTGTGMWYKLVDQKLVGYYGLLSTDDGLL